MAFDLTPFAETLGDPSLYFVDTDRPVPLVVEHATGEPHSAIVDGKLVPFEVFQPAKPPAPNGPPPEGAAFRANPGNLSGNLEVTNP